MAYDPKDLAADIESAGLQRSDVLDVIFRKSATQPWLLLLSERPGEGQYGLLAPGKLQRFFSLSEAMEQIEPPSAEPQERTYELVPVTRQDPPSIALLRKFAKICKKSETDWDACLVDELLELRSEVYAILAANPPPDQPLRFPNPIRFAGMIDQLILLNAPYSAMISTADYKTLKAGMKEGLALATEKGQIRGVVYPTLLPEGCLLFKLREIKS